MADQESSKVQDGRGAPAASAEKTTAARSREGRLIPGGSFEAARRPIGINAVDRDMLPSRGLSPHQESYRDTPLFPGQPGAS